MAQPPPYARGFDFTNLTPANIPEAGVRNNAEFDRVATTTSGIRTSLAQLQRDDGALKNAAVHLDSLSAVVRSLLGAGWEPKGAWVTSTVYAVKDVVTQGGSVYVALAAHTAGVFATDLAAQRWALLYTSDLLPAAGSIGMNMLTTAFQQEIAGLLAGLINVKVFGAVGNGTADDTAVIQSCINLASASGGGVVYLPPSRYKTTTALTQPNNVLILGAGDSSVLVLSTASMVGIQQINATETNAFIGVKNLAIEQAAAGCTGISWRLARFTKMEGVTFLGVGICFIIDRGKDHSLRGIRSIGTASYPVGGAVLTSLSDTDHVHHVTLTDIKMFNQGTGSAAIGLTIRRGVNVSVDDYHTYGTTGMIAAVVENGSEVVKFSRMLTAGCAAGLLIQQGSGVAAKPIYTTIKDSHIDQASAYGVKVDGGSYTVIEGVGFTPIPSTNSVPAISVVGAIDLSIQGCHVADLNGVDGAFVVFSGTASSEALITGNTVRSSTTGVNFDVACTNISVQDNRFDLVTFPHAGTIAGSGNVLRNNSGLNPIPVTATAIPASGTTQANGTGVDLRVYVNGGTSVSVYQNGVLVTTGLAASNYLWRAGESMRIDYSVVPTWTWVGC